MLRGALKHSPQKLLFNALQYVYIYIYFKYFTSFNTALKSSGRGNSRSCETQVLLEVLSGLKWELQVLGVVALREEGKSRSKAQDLQGSDKRKGSGRLCPLRHVWPGAGNDVGLPPSITGCLTDKG